jgi:hexosaminidase
MQLLPIPRKIFKTAETFLIPDHAYVQVQHPDQVFIAQRFIEKLNNSFHFTWEITASWAAPKSSIGLQLAISPSECPSPQGYSLKIHSNGIVIFAHDPAGLFYGVCTLNQMLDQAAEPALDCLTIDDWPDFINRGVMLDISRDKVPLLTTLMDLVDRLATWKINQVQLYTEHSFAYLNHPDVWQHATPMTGADILALDQFCQERFVQLVPNQNSFGHLSRWLSLPRYSDLAEIQGQFAVPWGVEQGPFSLSPVHPGSLNLVSSLYDELLPHFSSKMINVGCDETFDLGKGKSRSACEARGIGRVYLDFLLSIYQDLKRRGYQMMFWGDIILQHPELVPDLPSDMIAMPWGYESSHPFASECDKFASAGLEFYVCPGTSSWNSIGGRTRNSLENLFNAAENGLKNGASGYLNTDWGDYGHWQVLPISYLGFAAGAAYSWCFGENRRMGIDDPVGLQNALSLFAFDDKANVMGKVAYDLGEVYRMPGIYIPNSSLLFWTLRWPIDQVRSYPEKLTRILAKADPGFGIVVDGGTADPADVNRANLLERFERSQQTIQAALAQIPNHQMQRTDAQLIVREFTNSARIMQHACKRAAFAIEEEGSIHDLATDVLEFQEEYRRIWIERNRPGGLTDSLNKMAHLSQEYKL